MEKIFQKNLKILKYPSEPEERGDIPFITSTSLNNGINSYVNVNKKISFDKECLTISTNGQCFDVFLQDYGKFCISSDVEILYNSNLKKYHLLFLATVIKKERYR
ncbi:MAG: restriction endonuclease subunit S [Methanobrevibacter sp.]|nr:restriction endonuclease subunit S [Methanobrevibacter sp.]